MDSKPPTISHQDEEALLSFLDYLKTTSEYAGPTIRQACTAILNWHERGWQIDARSFLTWKQALLDQFRAYQMLEQAFKEAGKAQEKVEVASCP